MKVFCFELKKLLTTGALWGFLGICLLFNSSLIVINSDAGSYSNFIGMASNQTGYVLGDAFDKNLTHLSLSGERETEYLTLLRKETTNVPDVFDNYDTSRQANVYIKALGIEDGLAELMLCKYQALQNKVDKKAESDESLTLYFAGATYQLHQKLFGGVVMWLLTEGILLSVLAMLLSIGFEYIFKTDQVVFSTKTGRHILRPKFTAAVITGLIGYLLLTLITLFIYFSFNNYTGIWGSSISSSFNYINDLIAGNRPFATWHSYTVLSYLLAVIAVSMGLILCFMLMSFVIGTLLRNSYIGFLVFVVINAAFVLLPYYIPTTNVSFYLSALTPVWLWLKHAQWFTDGGIDILWPHFEMLGVSVSLLILTIFSILSVKQFRKKDLL